MGSRCDEGRMESETELKKGVEKELEKERAISEAVTEMLVVQSSIFGVKGVILKLPHSPLSEARSLGVL
jgi:hypothetical protein